MREGTFFKNNVSTAFGRVIGTTERDSKVIQSLIDASNSYIVIIDADRTVLFANRAWRQFVVRTGSLSRDCGIGKNYTELFSGVASSSHEDAAAIKKGLQGVIDNEEIEFQIEYECMSFEGPLWLRIHAAAFSPPASEVERFILICHDDISTSKAASDELCKDDERLRQLLKTKNILPWAATGGNIRFTYVGEQAHDLLGFSVDEWKAKGFWASRLHPDDRERVVAEYSQMSGSTDQFKSEYRMIARGGHVIWVEDLVDVVREWPKPLMMHGFMTDITERKQAEFVLAKLGGRLINAQEEERKRIARELHDDLNQRIALISIELEQLSQRPAVRSAGLIVRLTDIYKKVAALSHEIHRMSYDLHPSKLDHLGLVAALNSFCIDFTKSRDLKVDFQHESVPSVLTRDITLCIFRVVQEAVQNAAKYSGTQLITVRLRGSNNRSLELQISDSGQGFVTSPEKMTQGLGLTSMRERVRLVGGEFNVLSAPGKGTQLSAVVPTGSQ